MTIYSVLIVATVHEVCTYNASRVANNNIIIVVVVDDIIILVIINTT